jgi:hypothetical protein
MPEQDGIRYRTQSVRVKTQGGLVCFAIMYHEIQPGESTTISCLTCDREYKITFEPKAEDMNFREKRAIDPAVFTRCPFCGSPEGFHFDE